MDVNTNWNTIVNTALQASSVDGAEDIKATTVTGEDGNLTVTLTGTDGQTYTFTTEAPELDEATGEPTAEALATLSAKLDDEIEAAQAKFAALKSALTSTGTTATSTSGTTALFDIYSLMNLMIEISKKQREAARTERQADLNRVVADIKNQAEIQREAAVLGMILSVCTTAISVVAQGVVATKQVGAEAEAVKMEKAAGVDQTSGDLKLLTAEDGATTEKNMKACEKTLTADQLQQVRGTFGEATAAKGELTAAQTELKDATAARDQYVQEHSESATAQKVSDLDQQIADKQNEIATLETEIGDLQEDLGNEVQLEGESQNQVELGEKQNELTHANDDLEALKAQRDTALIEGGENDPELKKLNDKVTAAQTKEQTAEANFETKAATAKTKMDGDLARERLQLSKMQDAGASKDEIAAQEEKISVIEKQRSWGVAYVTDAKMDAGMTDSIAKDINSSQNILDRNTMILKSDAKYRQLSSQSMKWGAIGGMVQQVGQMLNTVVNQAAEIQSSSATDMQAQAKTDENMQQESDDLATSAQDLLKSVIQLLQQVLEAENQSIRQIVA